MTSAMNATFVAARLSNRSCRISGDSKMLLRYDTVCTLCSRVRKAIGPLLTCMSSYWHWNRRVHWNLNVQRIVPGCMYIPKSSSAKESVNIFEGQIIWSFAYLQCSGAECLLNGNPCLYSTKRALCPLVHIRKQLEFLQTFTKFLLRLSTLFYMYIKICKQTLCTGETNLISVITCITHLHAQLYLQAGREIDCQLGRKILDLLGPSSLIWRSVSVLLCCRGIGILPCSYAARCQVTTATSRQPIITYSSCVKLQCETNTKLHVFASQRKSQDMVREGYVRVGWVESYLP